MGTLGCINDMLQRDKENRELRKRNRERLTDTYHRLLDTGKETDLSQMTVENLEDIRRKTLEKEELDKATHFKAMLYLALGMALILLLVWLLVGCSGKPSGNNQSVVKSDSASITQGAQTISVHTQDTICHLPVATQSVKDSVFTKQELQKIQNELCAFRNKGHSIRRQYMGMGRIWESSYRKFMSKLSGSQSHFS